MEKQAGRREEEGSACAASVCGLAGVRARPQANAPGQDFKSKKGTKMSKAGEVLEAPE